jgi:hypothetical protein
MFRGATTLAVTPRAECSFEIDFVNAITAPLDAARARLRAAVDARHRRERDDAAVAALAHRGQDLAHGVVRPGHVHVERLSPRVELEPIELARCEDAGRGDEDRARAELCLRACGPGRDRRGVGYVHLEPERSRDIGLIEVEGGHPRPQRQECLDDPPPDSARTSGH